MNLSDIGGAALGYLGVQDTNDTNEAIAERATATNLAEAARNREFQQYNSDTAYQRQVKDLAAAGLNPMLGFMKASGASTPSGSTGSAVTYQAQNKVSSAIDAYNTTRDTTARNEMYYSSAKKADEEVGLIHANNAKITAETENVPLQGRVLERTAATLAEQLNVYFQEVHNKIKARELMTSQIEQLKANTKLLDLDASAAEDLDNLGRRSQQLKPIVDIIRGVIRK